MPNTIAHRTVSPHWTAALTVAFLAAVSWWSVAQVDPPSVVPATAPATEFSAERAVAHLHTFARVPHPVGTKAHDDVRDYILQQLSALGVQPEVQTATVVSPRWGSPYNAATVQNIVARLPGTASTRAVMLSGHYDSVSAGPGASDDGHAVAAELEAKGIPANEIAIVAKGKHDLLVPTADGVKEPQNRRVEIVYGGGASS